MIPEAHIRGLLDLQAEAGELSEFALEGNCMAPLLREGDRLRIRHGAAGLGRSDVAVFWSDGRLRISRVLQTSGDGSSRRLLAQSDSMAASPVLVEGRDIVGKAIAVRKGKAWLDLEAPIWRAVGRCLWLRAHVNVRRQSGRGLWRAADMLFRCRGLLPARRSLLLMPVSALVRTLGYGESAAKGS